MKKKVKIHYSSIFAIIFIIASLYLIHAILLFNKIETFARYVIVGVIGLIDLLILLSYLSLWQITNFFHVILY